VNFDRVQKIAEAVLYEGYMLYPYRPSSVKNQQRWNFGVLSPRSWSEQQQGSDAWTMQTECLVKGDDSTRLTIKVRFLQIVQRTIGRLRTPGQELPEGVEPAFDLVDRLEVAGRVFQPWQEAIERDYTSSGLPLDFLDAQPQAELVFPGGREIEYLRDDQGTAIGIAVRTWETLSGLVESSDCPIDAAGDAPVHKVTARVSNLTPCAVPATGAREAILPLSLVSAHTILGVEDGEFVSLLEPPTEFQAAVATCKNVGAWPVLAGDGPQTILSSPIILYDYPQIAEQSPGNLFDATEIDEILSLRILTLTDDEKREMQQSDQRAREILERTETMPPEQFMKMHGVLRALHPPPGEAP
jgi:hydrogenase maturation protease